MSSCAWLAPDSVDNGRISTRIEHSISISASLEPEHETNALYKYMGVLGAKKTLETGTVRFSRPVDFNDPFDMQVEEALGAELEQFLPDLMDGFHEFLSSDVDYSSLRPSELRESIILLNKSLKAATTEQRSLLKKELSAEPVEAIFDIERLRQVSREVVHQIHHSMQTSGVFCSTKRQDSLLMWAHYAQSHEGIVLKFLPDASKDSFFLASRPVEYVRQRPLLYRSAAEFIQHAVYMPLLESTRRIVERLTYSKSEEWRYENEYRLVIPDLVPKEEKFTTLEFWNHELSAIFLGCRMSEQNRVDIVALGKRLNQKVKIYQSIVSKREFALSFQLLKGSE